MTLFFFKNEGRNKMSYEYDAYLTKHKDNVFNGFKWLRDRFPEVFEGPMDKNNPNVPLDYEWLIGRAHDLSKTETDEYPAYDAYFYGGNVSYAVKREFNLAWLKHIHRNPHHWQHWVLMNDDANEGTVALDMPKEYIIEMVCDWWAFSWASGNLNEIFKWYDEHKANMILSTKTRAQIESLLYLIEKELEKE